MLEVASTSLVITGHVDLPVELCVLHEIGVGGILGGDWQEGINNFLDVTVLLNVCNVPFFKFSVDPISHVEF